MDDSMSVFSHFGKNCLICGLVGGAAIPLGPSRQRLLNKGVGSTAVASIAKAFGHRWMIGEC